MRIIFQYKTGQLKSQPDDIWLIAKIQELKSKLK